MSEPYGLGFGAQVFRQQAVAQAGDRGLCRGVMRLDEQVAFGVDAHGAVVQVRRADVRRAVVDDHQLGVQIDAHIAEPGVVRVVNAQAAVRVRRTQAFQQPPAQDRHGAALEPGAAAQARDDDDLRPVGFAQLGR
jgi:hypothetical protein